MNFLLSLKKTEGKTYTSWNIFDLLIMSNMHAKFDKNTFNDNVSMIITSLFPGM